ncbi:MAG: hypothetical protein IV100_16865 [Myxococcales bacterium]|nr:hypothetical protein [Myxococcales bacterium]
MATWRTLQVGAVCAVMMAACGDNAKRASNSDAQSNGASDGTEDTDSTDGADADDSAAPLCDLPEAEPPACGACLQDSCLEAYQACYCNSTCAKQLDAVRTCFATKNTVDKPSKAPESDFAACEVSVGVTDISQDYRKVTNCIIAEFTSPEDGEDAAEDPYSRTDGDGTCTWVCFEVFTLKLK